MSTAFRRQDGAVVLDLDADERAFLTGLFAQVIELVSADEAAPGEEQDPLAAMVGIGTATHLPLDPVLARLFPDAYQDAMAAGDFRRYTELHLRERKVRDATTATATLGRPDGEPLTEEQVGAWLGALNDLRLVLGTMLDVDEEDDVEERLAAPGADSYQVYMWLTWLQGALLDALAEAGD